MTSSDSIQVTLEESRYDRQERVSWWDQKRLKEARVLVVGAGALGNEVVKNLVLVGVGNIAVIDMDFIESSNLARCVFFRPEDEGQAKASVLAKRAGELNKDVVITGKKDDVVNYLNAMDVFVMPSLTETTCLAALEAMSCSLPVITTRVGSIKDYVIAHRDK